MDIMKVSNEIVGGVLVKDYAVYKNSTYYTKEWVQKDDKVWLIDPKDNLYQWIKKWSELLQFLEVLQLISSLIKTLIRGDSPYWNYLYQVGIGGIIYGC